MKKILLLFVCMMPLEIMAANNNYPLEWEWEPWGNYTCNTQCECCEMLVYYAYKDRSIVTNESYFNDKVSEYLSMRYNPDMESMWDDISSNITEFLRVFTMSVQSQQFFSGSPGLTPTEVCDVGSAGMTTCSAGCSIGGGETNVLCDNTSQWWTDTGRAGYQSCYLRDEICGKLLVNGTKSYRCADGYYGTAAPSGTSGCTKCTSPGTSDAGNNSAITKCYIPKNTTGSDTTGTYIYTTDCYYTY